jgi:hypothetical protein
MLFTCEQLYDVSILMSIWKGTYALTVVTGLNEVRGRRVVG